MWIVLEGRSNRDSTSYIWWAIIRLVRHIKGWVNSFFFFRILIKYRRNMKPETYSFVAKRRVGHVQPLSPWLRWRRMASLLTFSAINIMCFANYVVWIAKNVIHNSYISFSMHTYMLSVLYYSALLFHG